MSETTTQTFFTRDEAIARIRKALKARSGKNWSVTGGRGSAWSWITIHVPPAKRLDFGYMPEAERTELATLLNTRVHHQGVSIGASYDYRREFVARAEGRTPEVIAQPYWD